MLTTIQPGKLDSYEMLYLGFCGVLIGFFLVVLFSMYIESKVLSKLRPTIINKLTERIQEEFKECSFMISMDRSLTIRARPMMVSEEDEENIDFENMDYYDFLNYNRPEDDDFYNKHNPYELDPHEKNVMSEMVRRREKEIEREAKKGQRFKFFGKQAKE